MDRCFSGNEQTFIYLIFVELLTEHVNHRQPTGRQVMGGPPLSTGEQASLAVVARLRGTLAQTNSSTSCITWVFANNKENENRVLVTKPPPSNLRCVTTSNR